MDKHKFQQELLLDIKNRGLKIYIFWNLELEDRIHIFCHHLDGKKWVNEDYINTPIEKVV